MENVGTPEPWAIQSLLSPEEWNEFAALRDAMRERTVPCTWCEGTGEFVSEEYGQTCPACNGATRIDEWTDLWSPLDEYGGVKLPHEPRLKKWRTRLAGFSVPCPACEGRGYPCKECGDGDVSAFAAAVWTWVTCPRCEGSGSGNPPMGWNCGFCQMSGRVAIDRLEEARHISVGENYGGWPSIAEMALAEAPEVYAEWKREHDVRREAAPGVYWKGIDFSDDDLSGLDLSGAMLDGCRFGNVAATRFVGASLSGASFAGSATASAREANFEDAVLVGATFTSLDLAGSSIHLAADLADAEFDGVSGLTQTQIAECTRGGAWFDDRSQAAAREIAIPARQD